MEDEEGKNGSFEILPKTSKKLLLGFRPISVTFFDFKLPILMNEVIVKSFIKLCILRISYQVRADISPAIREDSVTILPAETWSKISPSRPIVATSKRTLIFHEPIDRSTGSVGSTPTNSQYFSDGFNKIFVKSAPLFIQMSIKFI